MKSMKKNMNWLLIAGLSGLLLSGCAHASNPAVPLTTNTAVQTASDTATKAVDEETADYTIPMDVGASESDESAATPSASIEPSPTPAASVEPSPAPSFAPVGQLSASIIEQKTSGFLQWKKAEITVQVKNTVFYHRSGRLLVTFTLAGQPVEKLDAFKVDLGAAEIRNYTFRSTIHSDAARISIETL